MLTTDRETMFREMQQHDPEILEWVKEMKKQFGEFEAVCYVRGKKCEKKY